MSLTRGMAVYAAAAFTITAWLGVKGCREREAVRAAEQACQARCDKYGADERYEETSKVCKCFIGFPNPMPPCSEGEVGNCKP